MPTNAEETYLRRKAAREAKAAAEYRALNFHILMSRHPNAGLGLKVGNEWDTSDGFRVRQVEAVENVNEPGHFIGTVEVIAFAGKYALPTDPMRIPRVAVKLGRVVANDDNELGLSL